MPLAAPTARIAVEMRAGPEALERVVESDLAAIVAPQMQRRIEAARHGDEIAGELALVHHAALALAGRARS